MLVPMECIISTLQSECIIFDEVAMWSTCAFAYDPTVMAQHKETRSMACKPQKGVHLYTIHKYIIFARKNLHKLPRIKIQFYAYST